MYLKTCKKDQIFVLFINKPDSSRDSSITIVQLQLLMLTSPISRVFYVLLYMLMLLLLLILIVVLTKVLSIFFMKAKQSSSNDPKKST